MNPTFLQIFVTLFVAFALSRVLLRLRDHELGVRESFFWAVIWVGITLVVWIPATALWISRGLGLSSREPIDTLVYMSIVVLFYLIYRINAQHERLEHELARLVRAIGIQQAEKRHKRK